MELKERLCDVLYDRIYADRSDLAFYLEIARRFPGPILEVGCGHRTDFGTLRPMWGNDLRD